MNKRSEKENGWKSLRGKIIGLGDLSIKKSHYPQLQKRLSELERFRAIMDQTNDGIVVVEISTGKIIDINSPACCHLNCNREEMAGLTIFERNTPFSQKVCEFIINNESESTLEIGLKNSSLEYLEIEARLKKVLMVDNSYVLILTRDISERKHLQEEKETLIAISKIFLQQNGQKNLYGRLLPLLLEKLGFTIISMELFEPESDTFNVISITKTNNLCVTERFQRNRKIITDKVFESGKPLVWKGDIKPAGIFHPILEDTQSGTVVCVPMKPDDKITGVILLASPHIRNDIDSVFQTVQVVGNHLALEIKRKITEEKLVERNRDLNDFADRVSHNLRNGLSIISGYLSIINEEPELLSQYYDRIELQIKKISGFVDRVTELSLAGSSITEKMFINLNSIVHSAFREQQQDFPSRLVLPSPLPDIFADHQGMRQVFNNIFANSFKYRNESRDVLIITITYQLSGYSIIISCRDNGSGLSEKNSLKIFDIGMSGKPGETTGFGLSIVKKIIESHGGAVRAFSEGKGKGTEIRIILPDVLVPGQNIQ